MNTTTFFTALAPDERVQGSRDPLGLLPIWARLGRRLIGNITTVSGDLRGWTTLLVMMGLYRDRVEAGLIDEVDIEPLFRAEQMIAYSRVLYGQSSDVRGNNQVKKHLRIFNQGKQPIPLGRNQERRILNAQQTAGVWGQISSPANASRLLDRPHMALSAFSRPLWSTVIGPQLAPFSGRITEILRDRRGFEPGKADEPLARVLADLHGQHLLPAEVPLYRDHILYGGQLASAPQGAFVNLWRSQADDTAIRVGVTLPRVAALAQHAREANLQEVCTALEHIVAAEQLLSPMEQLFSWVQSRHRQTLDDVVTALKKEWYEPIASAARGTDEILGPPVREVYGNGDVPNALRAIREALVAGAWADAILGVIALNAITMQRRGGAPWVQVVDNKLEVRLGDEQASLPTWEDLHSKMVHSYYLDPLRRLIVAWEDGQNG